MYRRYVASRPLIAERTPSRVNNFDALRLLAAVAVVISHSFALVALEQPRVGGTELGTVGVWVFFGISGFLIARSWSADPHLGRFLVKRALRILPALVVVVVLTTVVLGAVFTALPLGAYYADPDTWLYLVRNSVLVTTYDLPGVFVDNPYPITVNGPLWTLAPEVWAYLALAALGLLGALRNRWALPVVAAALIVWPREPTGMLPWPTEVFLLQAFAVGATLYIWRDLLPWNRWLAVAGTLGYLLVGPFDDGLRSVLAVTAVPYVALYLAYRGPVVLRTLTRHGDYSYGVYILGWPVGQAIVALWPSIGIVGLLAVALPVTYGFAALSWHVVEKPALALKGHLGLPARETTAVRPHRGNE